MDEDSLGCCAHCAEDSKKVTEKRIAEELKKFRDYHFEDKDSDHPTMTIHKSDLDSLIDEVCNQKEKDK